MENQTNTQQINSSDQKQKTNKKALFWTLGGIGFILVAGLVVLAVVFGQSLGKKISNQTPSTAENSSNLSEKLDTLQFSDQDTSDYVKAVTPIFDALDQSLSLWNDAADFGVSEDFENSSAKLQEGLDIINGAEKTYKELKPNQETEKLHKLVGESLQMARMAMEDGLRGNQDQDGEAIAASGQAIADLSEKLVQVLEELDNLIGFNENTPPTEGTDSQ